MIISDKTREQFEAWAATKGMGMHLVRADSGLYVSRVTQNYMDCWLESQAGQATEVQALREDAERYRWLNRQKTKGWHLVALVPMNQTDAYIDAAMIKEASN